MPIARLGNTIIAQSDNTVVVEGNHYFPPADVKTEYFTKTDTQSTCPWKGVASYYTVKTDDGESVDAAWTYEEPKEEAANIKDHIAFWKDVVVEE